MAAHEQNGRAVRDVLGDLADLRPQVQNLADHGRQFVQIVHDPAPVLGPHHAAHLRQIQREQLQADHLREERFRRCDGDLGARMRV